MDGANPRLRRELELIAREHGASVFGVADLEPATDFIAAQGGEFLRQFPRALSLAIRLSDAILDNSNPELPVNFSEYGYYNYKVVSVALDHIALSLTTHLVQEGHKAFPIACNQRAYPGKLLSTFSHKVAANLAGLGWIGKNSLLISPQFGPRLRFVTVLTDAPLETGVPLKRSCGRCRTCIDVCPVNAFFDREFRADEPVEMRMDPVKCVLYRSGNIDAPGGLVHMCGTCLSACPWGKRKNKQGEPIDVFGD